MLKISENSNPNYLATICRVDKLYPIVGADRLVRTVINGYDLVTSKDTNIGDIVVYFPVETAIQECYLSPNSLYSIDHKELNSNYEDVKNILSDPNIDPKEGFNKAKSLCGMFNQRGRVRILKIRGQYSQGFISPIKSLEIAFPELKGTNWDEYIGKQFDECCGQIICEKYIPLNTKTPPPTKANNKRCTKGLQKFDKLIPGQFEFHYDTTWLAEHILDINPDDLITITTKVHGTSVILSNILCNKELTLWENIKKFFGIRVKEVEFNNIYSSRRVIKNRYINKNANSFYETDVWGAVNDIYSRYLSNGMIVYGEIVGYCPGTSKFIQPNHDYGCKPGEFKFMPYRITESDEFGNKKEWDIDEVYKWIVNLTADHPKLKKTTLLPEILFSGRFRDLYDIPVDENWHSNVLETMKNDKKILMMECMEPMCRNKVPREGVVVRIKKDKFPRAWKLKSLLHYDFEAKENDKDIVNIEDNA